MYICLYCRSRQTPSKSFSPSESENDIEMKSSGKGLAPLKPKSDQPEDSGSISDIHTKAVNVSDNVYMVPGTYVEQVVMC